LFEINEAAQLVTDAAHPEANIIFGAVIDDALGDEVRVTVIAAGFDGALPRMRREPTRRVAEPPVDDVDAEEIDLTEPAPEPIRVSSEPERVPRREPTRTTASRPRRTIVFDDSDDLDVPDFLK
jgi:cell division protein FtsZ